MLTRVRRARRGQAAVFIAVAFMCVVVMMALATNMGMAVNDRIRMQSTADLSTYSVAYSEAATLNHLVVLNQNIADVLRDCRKQLESTTWPGYPCGCGPGQKDPTAEMIIQQCQMDLDDAILAFKDAAEYSQSVSPALDAGIATAKANFRGVEKHTTFFEDEYGSPTKEGTYKTSYTTNMAGGGTINSIANYEQVTDSKLNYRVYVYCGSYCSMSGTITTIPVDVATWFYKDSKDPDIWVAGRCAGTPKKQFLDTAYTGGGYFGASSTGGDDKLYAYAVAKPYDGSVGPSELGGHTRNGNMALGGVYASQGVTYPKLTMLDEYRARMAGIQDNLKGDTTPRDLVEQDGSSEGRHWDMDNFKH